MYTAGALAMRYGTDMDRALTAGLLHDCAKCIPNDKKIRMCKKNHIFISPAEYANPPFFMPSWEPIWRQVSIISGTGAF